MSNLDIRWKQRFENFSKAFSVLERANAIQEPNEIERAGLIQTFEFSFELAWKVLKDILEEKGRNPKFPRDTLKMAFETELIKDGHTWIDALNKRNLLAHTYKEETAKEAYDLIKNHYFKIVADLYNDLKQQAKN